MGVGNGPVPGSCFACFFLRQPWASSFSTSMCSPSFAVSCRSLKHLMPEGVGQSFVGLLVSVLKLGDFNRDLPRIGFQEFSTDASDDAKEAQERFKGSARETSSRMRIFEVKLRRSVVSWALLWCWVKPMFKNVEVLRCCTNLPSSVWLLGNPQASFACHRHFCIHADSHEIYAWRWLASYHGAGA